MKNILAAVAALGIASAGAEPSSVAPSLARSLSDSFANVYEKVAPSVVVIDVRKPASAAARNLGLAEGLDFFFRNPDRAQAPFQMDQGSGFLISADGYILTNNHVVDGADKGGEIKVTLKDGREFPAEFVGVDENSDLAVIRIDAKNLPFSELADSDAVRVGQFAFAIGAPFELPYTFTVGVVSAMGRGNFMSDQPGGNRFYDEYIQTDASINPGNSGGPLCDIDGRVVGINTLISGINRGLGFAVPSNIARDVSRQLIEKGSVTRPWLGISIVGIEESDRVKEFFPDLKQGVVVSGIEPMAPAAQSALQPGDVILRVDGVKVAMARDLQRQILTKTVGQAVKLDIWRGGNEIQIAVETGEQPTRVIRASNTRMRRDKALPNGESSGDALLGMTFSDPAEGTGAVISAITEDSHAAAAGLREGDLITEAGGQPVRSAKDLKALIQSADLDRGVMLVVDRRGGKTFAILKTVKPPVMQ